MWAKTQLNVYPLLVLFLALKEQIRRIAYRPCVFGWSQCPNV